MFYNYKFNYFISDTDKINKFVKRVINIKKIHLKVILEFEVFYNNIIAVLIRIPITFLSTIVINRISFQG